MFKIVRTKTLRNLREAMTSLDKENDRLLMRVDLAEKKAAKEQVVVRLQKDVFEKLSSQVRAAHDSIPRSELEAGWALGAFHVLHLLRTGFTIEDN